jgi:hypothetical protein
VNPDLSADRVDVIVHGAGRLGGALLEPMRNAGHRLGIAGGPSARGRSSGVRNGM